MNHIEAMKQALEALYPISHNSTDDYRGHADKAIISLRQAIAEAEKQEQGEPVAWIFKPNLELLWPHEVERKNPLELNEYAPLYTHPQPAPVQEPVAYRSRLASGSYTYCNTPQFFDNAEPLFTTPPAAQPKREWVGLDLDERSACYEKSGGNLSKFAKELEAKLKEKNT